MLNTTSVADELLDVTILNVAPAATEVLLNEVCSPLVVLTLAALTVSVAFLRVAVTVPDPDLIKYPVMVLAVDTNGSKV